MLRRQTLRFLSAVFILSCAAMLPRCHRHDGHGTRASEPGTHVHHEPATGNAAAAPQSFKGNNAVQNEMIYLQEAMQTILMLVSNNRLAEIPAALGPVHQARTLTEKAIEAKQYRAPKNPAGMEQFVQMDEAFHAELEKLVEAAARNDLEAASRQYGTVVRTCTDCHQKFRFP